MYIFLLYCFSAKHIEKAQFEPVQPRSILDWVYLSWIM